MKKTALILSFTMIANSVFASDFITGMIVSSMMSNGSKAESSSARPKETDPKEGNVLTLQELKARKQVHELKILLIRKKTVEKYSRESGNWILSSTMKHSLGTFMSALGGAFGALIVHEFESKYAERLNFENKPLTERQQHLVEEKSTSNKILSKQVIVGVVVGGAMGWLITQKVNEVEFSQVARLKQMDDQQIMTEYNSILSRIKAVSDELESAVKE